MRDDYISAADDVHALDDIGILPDAATQEHTDIPMSLGHHSML